MTAYAYKKIKDLQSGSKLQYFYGKIIFISKQDNKIIILLKDETDSIYLHVIPKSDQELRFELRQVLRVHRCTILATIDSKHGVAEIDKNGCHLIAWPRFGDVKNPIVVSSNSWTRCTEDSDQLKMLSELDQSSPKTTVEQIVNTLVTNRDTMKIESKVSSWLNGNVIDIKNRLSKNVRELFSNCAQTAVESQYSFSVDSTYFEDNTADELMQFVQQCNNCFRKFNKVMYVSKGNASKCGDCNGNLSKLKLAIRVRIISSKLKVFFTLPVHLISGGKHSKTTVPIIKNFESEKNPTVLEDQLEKLCQVLQKTLWNAALTKFKGVVVTKSEQAIDIYLEKVKLIDLVKDNVKQ